MNDVQDLLVIDRFLRTTSNRLSFPASFHIIFSTGDRDANIVIKTTAGKRRLSVTYALSVAWLRYTKMTSCSALNNKLSELTSAYRAAIKEQGL